MPAQPGPISMSGRKLTAAGRQLSHSTGILAVQPGMEFESEWSKGLAGVPLSFGKLCRCWPARFGIDGRNRGAGWDVTTQYLWHWR